MKYVSIPSSSYQLGEVELKKNAIYEKISDDAREYYISRSLQIGKETARSIQESGKDIYQLLHEHNIQLVKKKTDPFNQDFILRGEIHFTKKQSVISIYEDSINSIYQNYQEVLPSEFILTKEQAREAHLCHEFFHYLEFKQGQTVSQKLGKIQIPTLLGLTRNVEILECSEIAAHAFAKQFCQLNVMPNYYDVLYLQQRKLKRI